MDFFGKLYESGEDLESSPQNILSTFVTCGGEADQDNASGLLALAARVLSLPAGSDGKKRLL